ncbi:MAG: RimK family alpha-L-glutamate ligase [Alphaproteobacteria bacterium]|nr:RimK family alpha-L-glutamate ligase [Alphaproteobacteria bacterium]MCB9984117.1 RimK family alpha-L-glutamate ligase [Micavibrio sp.]
MKIWYIWSRETSGNESESYECSRLIEEGRKRGHQVSIYSPTQFKFMVGGEKSQSIFVDSDLQDLPDAVVSRMGSDTTYLGAAVLRYMQRNGVSVVNSPRSIERASDKLLTMQKLADKNIPIPKTIFSKCPVDSVLVAQQIGFPVVVKTLKGTVGVGVYLSENEDSLRDLTELLVHQGADKSPVIFQEFIETSRGRDVRVFCVGGKILACMERKSTDGGFKSNIGRGGVGKPVELTQEAKKIALDACNILELEIAGVDMLYGKDGFKICEVNSAPDFNGLETYCEVNAAEAIYEYIETRVEKDRKIKKAQKGGVANGFFDRWIKGRHAA